MFRSRYLALLLILFISCLNETSNAGISIPTNLNKNDRQEALRIVGFGTSSKLLTDPYPMGGYDGFEAGLAVEDVPTDGLGLLGAHLSSPQQDVAFPQFSIGKGLFNNLDLYVHFTPYSQQDALSIYGCIVRWGFYQAKFLPLSASVLVHIDSTDVGNVMATQTYGFDLIGGINVDAVALYFGGGYLQTSGTFIGTVTDTSRQENETVTGLHTSLGANIKLMQDAFLSLQIDRYTVAVLSAKLGIRY